MSKSKSPQSPSPAVWFGVSTPPIQGLPMGPDWAFGMTGAASSILGFAARRWAKDLDAQQALLGCTSLADIQRVQMDYMHDAVRDFTIEMPRLLAGVNASNRDESGLDARHADDHMGV